MHDKVITITFHNGLSRKYPIDEFEQFGYELEHRTENLIIDIQQPSHSFTYETDDDGEIINKEPIVISYI